MGTLSVKLSQTKPLRVIHRQRDRGTPILIFLILVLMAVAALIFAAPWETLAFRSGQTAVPTNPVYERPLAASIDSWCVDFTPNDKERQLSAPMRDNGTLGDKVAGDGIYSLRTPFAEKGMHAWRVVACNVSGYAFPEQPSWIQANKSNQELTLTFDTNQYTDEVSAAFLPNAYSLNVSDQTSTFFLIGSMYEWRNEDERISLQKVPNDRYRLVYQIPKKGNYRSAIAVEGDNGKIFGYWGDGRSMSWNMLRFRTRQKNDTVVFELDPETGRSMVLYDMSRSLSWLAYENGYVILSSIIIITSLVTALLVFKRYQFIRRLEWHAEAGCPSCGGISLTRAPRTPILRVVRFAGVNTGQYVCRQCVWEGGRLAGGKVTHVVQEPSGLSSWFVVLGLLILFIAITATLRTGLNGNGSLPDFPNLTPVDSQTAGRLIEPQIIQSQLTESVQSMIIDARSLLEQTILQPYSQPVVADVDSGIQFLEDSLEAMELEISLQPGVITARKWLESSEARAELQELVDNEYKAFIDARNRLKAEVLPINFRGSQDLHVTPDDEKLADQDPAAAFSPIQYDRDPIALSNN